MVNKAKTTIHGLSHKFLRNHNEIRVLQKYHALAAISGYRAVYLAVNGEIAPADHYSPNIAGFLATDATIPAAGSATAVVAGPAYAYPQSSIEPLLPIKVTENGRITHGIQKIHTGRTIYTAAAGEDGTEVATPAVVGSGATDKITAISDDTDDTTQEVIVYGYSSALGIQKLTGILNGTTEVVLKYNGTETDDITLVYGCQLSAAAAGEVKIEDYTNNTDLIVITAGNTTAGYKSATNPTFSYGRKVIVTFSAADAADSVVLVGTDLTGNEQYEMIMGSNGNCPLVLGSANRYRTIDYILDGNLDDAHNAGVTGLASNSFILAHNDSNNITYDDADQPVNLIAGVEATLNINRSSASDNTATVYLIGYDNTNTCVVETVTISAADNGTTDLFMEVCGAYLSSDDTLDGDLDIEEEAGNNEIISTLDASYTSAGMLGIGLGHSAATAAIAHDPDLDLPGCNSRFTLTNSGGGTDVVCVIGEDVDGTVQREKLLLHDGVAESIYTWSRIRYIACVEMDKTEYLTLSFEQEDDGQEFCGVAIGSADAQSTSTAVEIWVKEAYGVQWGKGADQAILQRVIGTTGYTDIDTYASAARTVFFPDASGMIFLTGASANTNIITIGATDCDYATLALAIAAPVTAGDWLWMMDDAYSGAAQTVISIAGLRITGMSGGPDTEWPLNKVQITSSVAAATGSTIEVTAAGCVFENLEIKNTANTAATDCALQFTNVGGEVRNCTLTQSNSKTSLWFTNNAAADDLTLTDVYMNEDFTHDGGTASATLKASDVYIGGVYTTADKIIVDAQDVEIVGASTIVGGVHVYKNSEFTGAVSLITTAGTFTAYDSIFTGLFTSNITANTVSIYNSTFADKLYLDDCGTIVVRDSRIVGDLTNSVQTDAIATSATFFNCDLIDQLLVGDGPISFYGGSLEDMDINETGATGLYLYNVYVSGALDVTDATRTDMYAYGSHFASTITMLDVTRSDVTLVDCFVSGAVGYTQATDMNFNAAHTIFDSAVTEVSGVGVFTGCTFEGGMAGITVQAASSALLNTPATIRTIGVGCHYPATLVGITAAQTDASDGDTILIYASISDIDTQLTLTKVVTWIGMGDDIKLSGAVNGGSIIELTTNDGMEFYNINFDNTHNSASATGIQATNVVAKFVNCEFESDANVASIGFDADLGASDVLTFRDCSWPMAQGVGLDFNGTAASSIIRAYNCDIYGGDNNTGYFYGYGCNMTAAYTTTSGNVYWYGSDPANVDATAEHWAKPGANVFTVGVGGDYGANDGLRTAMDACTGGEVLLLLDSSYTLTTASLAIDVDVTILGMTHNNTDGLTLITSAMNNATATVSVTDGVEIRNVKFTNSGVAGAEEGLNILDVSCKLINCDISSTTNNSLVLDLAGTDTVEFINTSITGASAATIDSDVAGTEFLWRNGKCNPAVEFGNTDGTYHIKDVEFTGAVTHTNGEAHFWDCDFLSTFGTLADDAVYIDNCDLVGAVTLNNNALTVRFKGCEITAAPVWTDFGLAEFSHCHFDLALNSAATTTTLGTARIDSCHIDDASTIDDTTLVLEVRDTVFGGTFTISNCATEQFHNTTFVGAYANTGVGTAKYIGCDFQGAATWNDATDAYDVAVYSSVFEGLMTITDLDIGYFQGCRFVPDPAIVITDCDDQVELVECFVEGLLDINGTTDSDVHVYGGRLEEIDQDGTGDLVLYNTIVAGITNSGGTVLNAFGTHFVGQLTDAAATTTLANCYLDTAPAGTIAGDYQLYSANAVQTIEGGFGLKSRIGVCSFGAIGDAAVDFRITDGWKVIETTVIATGQEWAHNIGGANATPGFWQFDAINEYMSLGVPIPSDYAHTGVQADFVVSIYYSSSNATDELDYEFTQWDGTSLEESTDMAINAGPEWIDLGSGVGDHIVEGEPLILSIGNCSQGPGGGGATITNIYAFRITYRVGRTNHS